MSTVVSSYFLGLLVSYIFGGYLNYNVVVYLHLSMSILYIVMLALLKESPVFLMQRGKEKVSFVFFVDCLFCYDFFNALLKQCG